MSRFWHVVLGLDKAADGLLSPARDVTADPDNITISAMLGALAVWREAPAPTQARAQFWLNRVEGFFLFWRGQHCHCADAAAASLQDMKPEVVLDVGPTLKARIDAAHQAGLRTTL